MFTSLSRVAASLFVALCLGISVLSLAGGARAQETQTAQRREGAPVIASPTPAPSPAAANATTPMDGHDLSITANVTARELLFEVVPNPTVEFSGRPRRDTVWEAERTNLPAQVQPGVTYRDIGIRLRITSVFADIERIVAEALGEIPSSDDGSAQTLEPNANPLPQVENATAARSAAHANSAPQAASSATRPTSSRRAARPSSAQTTHARGRGGNATARRGRH